MVPVHLYRNPTPGSELSSEIVCAEEFTTRPVAQILMLPDLDTIEDPAFGRGSEFSVLWFKGLGFRV